VRKRERERERERRERSALRAFIASSGRRGDGDCRPPFFFECTSANIFTFSTPLRVTSVPPSASRHSGLYLRSVISSLSPCRQRIARASTEASLRSKRVRDRDYSRETGGTRPAAIPRYTNLLAKLAKLARGFWNSKMARISA